MNKAQEIDLLQKFTVQAREAGAEYLHDALCALAVPFETAIRSDFPGKVAAFDVVDLARQARIDLEAIRQERNKLTTEALEKGRKLDEITRSTRHAEEQLNEIRIAARRILSL